ncbi:histidine phosphatase family protein [Deinococcus taeanensis]|uniref:histidine phosphatase family protein n=1 Tax=Deinococcus taeanensis TaxID=2737050 RepID=UPI001CDBAAF4|nr:histidine phosphatase family protein [Deinococcus taeanensis]UBV43635.1 histidine phosphatase family protein [Deinococcus taeanensis]
MILPAGSVLLVRHARAAGQAPDAPLTPAGEDAARTLATALTGVGISRLVSSPWRRAAQTLAPLGLALNLPVAFDDRLTERVLSAELRSDWQARLRDSFEDDTLVLPGGESGAAARTRALAALTEHRDPDGVTVLGTHGNLLALMLGLDFPGWAALRNPDVWHWAPGAGPARWAAGVA